MADLLPLPIEELLRRIYAEWERQGAIFDLPERAMWHGAAQDLSVHFHGARAATPLGPAAGPQSQLAQNLALCWLGGSRIFELKTVQVNDRLVIPRPCIDAHNIGFNVEWSQELRLQESLAEYVKGWFLIHVLEHWNPCELRREELGSLFDISVGYSLEGVRSDPVARWIDGMRDASGPLRLLRDGLPSDLRALSDVAPPSVLSENVTLSTFHGCRADEIERIAERLFERHDLNVVIKMNPTLLGFDRLRHLLHDVLGYHDLRLRPEDFAQDLGWDHALQMMERLDGVARRRGRHLGVKFSNTLIVENHKDFFPESERTMYLSGQPLHVITTTLAHRFAEATQGRWPVSFSGGVDAWNFHECVAAGFVPVTTSTDLLRPGGYGRLVKYLDRLAVEMRKVGADTIDALVKARAGDSADERPAWRRNLEGYTSRVASEPRYHASRNSGVPRRLESKLALFDCVNCDKCVPVCPNDANFSVEAKAVTFDAAVLRAGQGRSVEVVRVESLSLGGAHQLANFADACNECGNCDVFCPELGGPYKVKPRFFHGRATYDASPALDGFVVESPKRMRGRIEGTEYVLDLDGETACVSDGHFVVRFDRTSGVVLDVTRSDDSDVERELPMWRPLAMSVLLDAVLGRVNPVSARFLAPTER